MQFQFAIFPIELLQLDLSETELRVLIALYSFRDKHANTVWPSLDLLAERAGVKDKTRVSKITSKLMERNLITKKKRGFTGGNVYGFVSESDDVANLDESAKLGEKPKLGKCANAKLDESANSNLDESAKCNELTNEHTNEHTRELGSPPAQRNADAQRTHSGCRLPDDWTPDVVFAASNGMSDLDALTEAERFRDYWRSVAGAKGRKSDWQATWRNWIRRAVEQRPLSRTPPDRAGSPVSFAERHTDQSWRVGL